MIRRLDDATLVRISRGVVLCAMAAVLVAGVGYVVRGKAGFLLDDVLLPFVALAVSGTIVWLAVPTQPRNAAVWVFVSSALFMGIAALGGAIGVLAEGLTDAELAGGGLSLAPADVGVAAAIGLMLLSSMWAGGLFPILTAGVLLFPDGRLPSRRWRWVMWIALTGTAAIVLGYMWATRPSAAVPYQVVDDEPSDVTGAGFMFVLIAAVASIVGLAVKYRRSRGDARQQIRWVVWGFGFFVAVSFVPAESLGFGGLGLVGPAVFAATYAVAITKYRLYDIDVVISKTVVYGLLAVFIGGVYALVVVGVGSWIGAGTSSPGLSITATAMVAVAFEPVRALVQRVANRVVYGKRATPYQVLADLTSQLASAESSEGLMERMVQRLAEGTGAARAVIRLEGSDEPVAVWPADADVDVNRSDEFVADIPGPDGRLGTLAVLKARGETPTSAEKRIVDDLAGSAGMVLNKARLDADLAARAEDLRRSRRRMMDAQDEERRRLERDLHDGAQQQIVALKVKLGLAARLADEEGSGDTASLIREMADNAQDAIEEIRSLAKGIFPPLLENEGLRAALSAGAANVPIPVIVDGDGLARFSGDMEAAAYFCITEAITNAVKYSGASRVDVRLRNGDGLEFTVHDDGVGFDTAVAATGSGLVGMRDRLEVMGGSLTVESAPGRGTTITGRLPATSVS